MRIILDTDKKTITIPWNYAQKLDEMNKIIEAAGGEGAKKWDGVVLRLQNTLK